MLWSTLSIDPATWGNLSSVVENSWFQDPLIKTFKYLENLDSKDEINKVSFLNGLVKILDKFDKWSIVRKIFPLVLI